MHNFARYKPAEASQTQNAEESKPPSTETVNTQPPKKVRKTKKNKILLPKANLNFDTPGEEIAGALNTTTSVKDDKNENSVVLNTPKNSNNLIPPPQVLMKKVNVNTEDLGKYFTNKHLQQKSELLKKRSRQDSIEKPEGVGTEENETEKNEKEKDE